MTGINLTRRRSIALGATALATAGTGLALGTERAGAQANVEMGTLDVQDGEFSPEDGAVYGIWLLINGSFEYQVNAEPAEWQAYMLVGNESGDTEAVGLTSGSATAREDSGTYALRGPVTAASFYDADSFTVPEGQHSVSRAIPVTVVFLVRNSAGDTLAQARVSDDAVVTIDDSGMPQAALSGTGTIVAQDDQGDATPTPPEV